MGPYRSLWRAVVSFGLVSIPVKVYAASQDQDVHLRQLHRRCHSPIQYRKWCPVCNAELDPDDIEWGYELAPGRFVTVTEEEIAGLPLPEPHVIQILDFVRLAEVDPAYFQRPYYLEPGEAAGRAYRLLVRSLARSGRAAIARLAIRRRETLAALRPATGDILALVTMRYADELRRPQEVVQLPASAEPSEREQEMALELIERLTAPFEPDRYASQRRRAFAQLLERKAAGEPVTAPERPEAPAVADLVEALRASLAQVDGASGSGSPAAPDGRAAAGRKARRRPKGLTRP